MKIVIIWALWVSANEDGYVSSQYNKTYVAAYFATEASCVNAQRYIHPRTQWTKCIPGEYVTPPTPLLPVK